MRKSEIMEGVVCQTSKIIAPNTVGYWTDGVYVIRLYRTDIIKFYPDYVIELNSGGFKTKLTKRRIEQFSNVRIDPKNYVWYLRYNGFKSVFYDGIKVNQETILNPTSEISPSEKLYLNLINRYHKKIESMEKLPRPDSGDCWKCMYEFQKITPRSKVRDISHIINHLEDEYVHGTLILLSLKWENYNNFGLCFDYFNSARLARIVKRFLIFQLGI